MEHRVKNSVKNIEISGIRQFNTLASKLDDVIFFTLGQPTFNTDNQIKEAAKAAIDANHTFYTKNQGIDTLREAMSAYVAKRYQLNYSSDEIIFTVGATQALSCVLNTIIEKDDEVIVLMPAYPGYAPLIELNGGKVVEVDTKSSAFQIDSAKLSEAITKKTKCIILTTPSNPTGVVYSKESIQAVADLVKAHDIFVIADEIYRDIIFSNTFNSIGSCDIIRNNTIIVSGFSKSHAMMGWRIGYILADKSISQHLLKTHQYSVTSTCSISQYAALEALKTDNQGMIDFFYKQQTFTTRKLTAMGIEFVQPQGAFYIFAKCPGGMSSIKFCLKLLNEAKVACIPGRYFGENFDDYFRVSYACNQEALEEGLKRLENFLEAGL